jgi:hypothetical protein
MARKIPLEQALYESRRKITTAHGPGAWDVADVMEVLKQYNLKESNDTNQEV